MSVLCGAPKGADFVVPTIPRPLFPENMVCTHVATLGGEPEFVIQLSTPPKPLVLHQLSNVSPLGPENITEEAAAKAVTTFFQYTMTPRGSWCIIDVTRENVKEEELRSRVNNAKDVQRTKSKLDQHKRSQVDQLIADLNGRESDRRFQWFPGAITREGKSLVVTVERGPKVGLQASAVYNAAMASPSSFLPGQSRVSLGSSRPEDSRVCFNNTEERSGYHIIILAYKDTLGWVETNNGPASG
jgi:hypothetical protein